MKAELSSPLLWYKFSLYICSSLFLCCLCFDLKYQKHYYIPFPNEKNFNGREESDIQYHNTDYEHSLFLFENWNEDSFYPLKFEQNTKLLLGKNYYVLLEIEETNGCI